MVQWIQKNFLNGLEGGFYGTLTFGSLAALFKAISITEHDTVLDLGSGAGAVCVYATATYGCQSIGIELDRISIDFSLTAARRFGLARCSFFHGDFGQVKIPDINCISAIVAYDRAFPPKDLESVNRWIARCPNLRTVATSRRRKMETWSVRCCVATRMQGSGNYKQFYVYDVAGSARGSHNAQFIL
jgi:hypothetical protein